MNPYLKRLHEERASHVAVISSLREQAASDERDLSADETKTLEERSARIAKIDTQLEFEERFAKGNAKYVELVGARQETEERTQKAREDADSESGSETTKTVSTDLAKRAAFGRRFVESPEFKAYRGAGTSARVELPGPASEEFRAAITLGDFAELPKQFWAGPAGYTTTTPLLDRLGRVATSQAAVQYLYWGTTDPLAQKVAEGALKPEADLGPESKAIQLDTYAHWKAITRQALEDIAQIQSIIQNKLLRGVGNALERAAAETLTADAAIPAVSAADLTTGIRMGLATIETDGFTANAIVVNPTDAAKLDLEALANTSQGAVRNGSVWGQPVVAAGAVPEGTAFVGDFTQGITWFDRGVTDVFVSDSHADFFLRNQLVILAEARAAFAVTEPVSLVKVTAPAGGGEAAPAARKKS